jgi:hypothetical protein
MQANRKIFIGFQATSARVRRSHRRSHREETGSPLSPSAVGRVSPGSAWETFEAIPMRKTWRARQMTVEPDAAGPAAAPDSPLTRPPEQR